MSQGPPQAQWTPNGAMVGQITSLLKLFNTPSQDAQQQALKLQQDYQRHPEYMCYLALVMCSPDCDRVLRQQAALALKNFVRLAYGTASPLVKTHVKQSVMRMLGDAVVRRPAAYVVSSIVEKEEGFARWPGLLESLLQGMTSPNSTVVDGTLYCMELLCEDCTRELIDHQGRPLNAIMPVLIAMLKTPLRLRALRAINRFIVDFPNALKVNLNAFLEGVFLASNDTDPQVLFQVCRTFTTFCDIKPAFVGQHIGNIASFMLRQTSASAPPDVRSEACEFWQVLSEQVCWHEVLRSKVPQLLPQFLDGIIYNAEAVDTVMDIDDARVPLSERDIAPWFAKVRFLFSSSSSSSLFSFLLLGPS